MPGGDRTGPMGEGPMTGRRAGYCSGNTVPGYASGRPAFGARGGYYGRGGFAGRGGGRHGYRNMYYMTGRPGWMRPVYPDYPYQDAPPIDEKEMLSSYADQLKNELEEINRRLETLDRDNG